MTKSAEHRADSRTLVLGGIRSGKSRMGGIHADRDGGRCATSPPARWLTTSSPGRSASAEHRSRRPSDWCTVETGDVAGELRAHPGQPTLVDDLGGWLTARAGRTRLGYGSGADDDIDDLAAAVEAFTAPLVLVSPEVGSDAWCRPTGRRPVVSPTSRARSISDWPDCCDQVVLVVAGQPLWVKSAAGSGGAALMEFDEVPVARRPGRRGGPPPPGVADQAAPARWAGWRICRCGCRPARAIAPHSNSSGPE